MDPNLIGQSLAPAADLVGRAEPTVKIVGGPHTPEANARKNRNKVTNGRVLIPGVSGRLPWVTRCRDIIAAYLSDLGGEANTSEAERSIIRRVATLTVELERLEKKFALAGEACDSDLDLYQRCSNTMRRHLESIGLQRRAKDIGITPPTAEEYFAFKQRQKEQQQQKDGEVRT